MDKNIAGQKLAVEFAALTMGITWIFWWTIVVANRYGYLEYGSLLMMLFYMIGGLSPTISAIALLLKAKQMTGRELVRTICDFRQSPLLYVIVIIIAILSYMIPMFMNKATVIAPLYMSVLLIPFNLIGGGLEEIGWRFFFQPALEKKTNFILATLTTAIVWALWHLPLFFIAGTNQFTWSFWSFAVLLFGMSFALAAIYRVSGSIFLCILYHTVWNAIGESIAINMDMATTAVISIVLIAISFILIRTFPNLHR